MHLFNIATLFLILTLVGIEFSVSAFVNPAAWRLEPEAQLKFLSRCAFIGGRVMPVWYPICGVMLILQTWLHWHTPGRALLLTAVALWVLVSLLSIFFLVPLNNRVIKGVAGWQQIHHTWDKVHRIRIAAIAIAAILLTSVLVR